MKKLILIASVSLVSACSAAPMIPPGQAYVPPMGGFSCRTHPHFETKVDAAFGPHGGTVRLINEIDTTRVDVEEINPAMDVKTLADNALSTGYDLYLSNAILPQIKRGTPDAKILWKKDTQIKGRRVLLSAILLPGKSSFTDGNGKVADGIRAEIQYMNGRYIYTVSTLDYAREKWTEDAQMNFAFAKVSKAFDTCDFPE